MKERLYWTTGRPGIAELDHDRPGGRQEFRKDRSDARQPSAVGPASFVAIALFFFAFTTLMAYYYIAETNIAYLTRKKGGPALMLLLKIGILAAVFFGCIRTAKLAWDLGDMGVGIMAC